MMTLVNFMIAIGIVSVIWYIVATLLIYETLRKKKVQVNFLLLKLMAPVYASKYREITRCETGKTGPLFFHWIISINLALAVCVLIALIRFI